MLPFSYFAPLPENQYADVPPASLFQQGVWSTLRMEYDKADKYYRGLIFQERVETEVGEGEAPLLYPVGINLVKRSWSR